MEKETIDKKRFSKKEKKEKKNRENDDKLLKEIEKNEEKQKRFEELIRPTNLDSPTILLYRYAIKQRVPFSYVMVLDMDSTNPTNVFDYVWEKISDFVIDSRNIKKPSKNEESSSNEIPRIEKKELERLQETIRNVIDKVNESLVFKFFQFDSKRLQLCFLSIYKTRYELVSGYSTETRNELRETLIPQISKYLFENINPDDEDRHTNYVWQTVMKFCKEIEKELDENEKFLTKTSESLRELEKLERIKPKAEEEDGSIIKAHASFIPDYSELDENQQTRLERSFRSSKSRLSTREGFVPRKKKEFIETELLTKKERKILAEITKKQRVTEDKEEENWETLEVHDEPGQTLRKRKDLEFIFASAVATEFVPRITMCLDRREEAEESLISTHKIFNSDEMTSFIPFKDDKEKPNTIRLRVLTSKAIRASLPIKHSKSSRMSKMEEDTRIKGVKINKDMFTDVVISLKFSTIRYYCPRKGDFNLVNRRIVEAFPALKLTNFVQTRICYTLLFPVSEEKGEGFDETSFSYATTNDPVISVYFSTDETKGKLSSRRRISHRCRGFLSAVRDEKDGQDEVISSSNSYTLSFRPTLVTVGQNIDDPTKVQKRLKIKISKAVSQKAVSDFIPVIGYALAYYFKNLKHFRKCSAYSEKVLGEQVKVNTRENPDLGLLKEALGKGVIESNYGTWCPKEKQPTIIPEEDVPLYENSTATYLHKTKSGKIVERRRSNKPRKFVGENGPVWLMSKSEEFPFVIFKTNTIANANEYPLLPRCSDTPTEKGPRQREFIAGKNRTHIIKNSLAVQHGNFGKISPIIESLLFETRKGFYFRRGVIRDSSVKTEDDDEHDAVIKTFKSEEDFRKESLPHKSSMIHAVLEGLEEFLDNNEFDSHSLSKIGYKYLKKFFKIPKGKSQEEERDYQREVVSQIRKDILNFTNIELCAQSVKNFNKNKKSIKMEVMEDVFLFDPVKFVRLLEEFFDIDIYVLGKKSKGERPNFLIPFHESNKFYARATRHHRPCVLIYRVKIFSDSFPAETSYPQYETIVRSSVEKPTKKAKSEEQISKTFKRKNSKYLSDVLEKTLFTMTISSQNTYIDLHSFSILDISNVQFSSQMIDSFGKSQLFIGNLVSDNSKICIMTIPVETINVRSCKKDAFQEPFSISLNKVLDEFGSPSSVSIVLGEIVGLWYSIKSLAKEIIYIPCVGENPKLLKAIQKGEVGQRSPHTLASLIKLNSEKVEQKEQSLSKTINSFTTGYSLVQVCRWLFTIFIEEKKPKKYSMKVPQQFIEFCFRSSDKVVDSEISFEYCSFFPKNVDLERAIEFVNSRLSCSKPGQMRIRISRSLEQKFEYQARKMNLIWHSTQFVIPTEIEFDPSRLREKSDNSNLIYLSTENLNSFISKVSGENIKCQMEFQISDQQKKNLFIYRGLFNSQSAEMVQGQPEIYYLCLNISFTSSISLSVEEDGFLEDVRGSHILAIAYSWLKNRTIPNIGLRTDSPNGNQFSSLIRGDFDPSIPIVIYGINSYNNLSVIYKSFENEHDENKPFYEVVSYSSQKLSNSFCILLRL